ncbi:MAG: GGDEF domain-containing protein [Campylobacterota bacterium]|nr:GGDEF domain-containing protein [Campylobacterota bacterium]
MFQDLEYLFKFVKNIPVGIVSADTKGKSTNKCNRYFLEMFGWELCEIDTLDKWFIKAYPNKKYREYIIGIWDKAIEETETNNLPYSKTVEVKVACKGGAYKWCEARYYRQDDFMFGIFVDITESKKTNKLLYDLTSIDHLTQVNNRRSYHKKVKEFLSLYKRYGTTFSMLLLDIDDFKLINDTYGHQKGDDVLIKLCKLIKSNIRQNDHLFRIGGEEFILLLQNTNLENSENVANNILKIVSNDLTAIKDKTITVSMGLSEVTLHDTEDSLYKRVDDLLYSSKENGKNRVTSC